MKNFRITAICLALVLGLAASIFAVSRLATKNVAAKSAAACCSDASCCSGGACKMNGACCANHGASQNHQAHHAAVKTAGVAVENADAVSCHENKAQTAAAADKKDCCANGGSACCKTGASCCQSKAQTSTARL